MVQIMYKQIEAENSWKTNPTISSSTIHLQSTFLFQLQFTWIHDSALGIPINFIYGTMSFWILSCTW